PHADRQPFLRSAPGLFPSFPWRIANDGGQAPSRPAVPGRGLVSIAGVLPVGGNDLDSNAGIYNGLPCLWLRPLGHGLFNARTGMAWLHVVKLACSSDRLYWTL